MIDTVYNSTVKSTRGGVERRTKHEIETSASLVSRPHPSYLLYGTTLPCYKFIVTTSEHNTHFLTQHIFFQT